MQTRVCRRSEEKFRFFVFGEPNTSSRLRVTATASDGNRLVALTQTPLMLHAFSGVDEDVTAVPSGKRVHWRVDLAGTLLPASMGGLVRSSGRSGLGSVQKNEVGRQCPTLPRCL